MICFFLFTPLLSALLFRGSMYGVKKHVWDLMALSKSIYLSYDISEKWCTVRIASGAYNFPCLSKPRLVRACRTRCGKQYHQILVKPA